MRSVFFSRISIPLWTAIWGFIILVSWMTTFRHFSFERFFDQPLPYLPMLLLILFLLLIFLGTYYKVMNDHLVIKVGPFSIKTIEIMDIKSVERTYELIASLANAIKRLRIRDSDTFVLISPCHEKEFIKLLKTINPEIQIGILERSIKF